VRLDFLWPKREHQDKTMDSIDLRSIYLLIAFMNLFIPLVTWGIARPEHSRAINLWCAGGLLLALGTLLVSFRDTFASIGQFMFVGNMVFLLSIVYRVEGILDFMGKRQNMPL
jgi:hypothetical protein